MKRPLHFRREIRNAFIMYALIPVTALIILITVCSFCFWSVGINRQLKVDNQTICGTLEQSICNYAERAEQPFEMPVRFFSSKGYVSQIYSGLNEFVRKQTVNANFVVLDSEYTILLQGDTAQPFRIPSYQKTIAWGPLQRMEQHPDRTYIEISHEYSPSSLAELVIGRSLERDGSTEGFLVFTITARTVQEALKGTRSPYVITDTFGDVFDTTNNYYLNDFGKLDDSYRTRNGTLTVIGDMAICHNDICGGTLCVYTILDISQTRRALATLVMLSVILIILMTAGMIISAEKIAADKTRTIDELVKAFHAVKEGNLENHVAIQGNIEFQTIGEAYNKMLDDIKHLIAENEKETRAKYISELKQLEMQFNPHFLYNTLATVRYLVKLDPDGAVRTIVSLSELLRYSIKTESSMVELENDMKYIENYMAILKTRFGSKFSYSLTVPDDCRHASVPKLLLQPVIENAVKHGFEGVSQINITVSVQHIGDLLRLTLTDTGCGMSPDMLREMTELLTDPERATSHIGLYNVQRRIQLVYGNQYGLSVESTEGSTDDIPHGTTVIMNIPFKEST